MLLIKPKQLTLFSFLLAIVSGMNESKREGSAPKTPKFRVIHKDLCHLSFNMSSLNESCFSKDQKSFHSAPPLITINPRQEDCEQEKKRPPPHDLLLQEIQSFVDRLKYPTNRKNTDAAAPPELEVSAAATAYEDLLCDEDSQCDDLDW